MPAPVAPLYNSATAFQASGLTVAITANDTPVSIGVAPCVQVVNTGTAVAFLAFGKSNVTVGIPVAGTPANGIPIPAGACLVLGVPPGSTFATQHGVTGGDLYLTPGAGL